MRRSIVTASIVLCVGPLTSPAQAQFTDLQPGRNFPVTVSPFGTGESRDIDVGDVDGDGDLDVILANTGSGLSARNRIFINKGGLQGGEAGSFGDQTAVRFADAPIDASENVDFADIDGDGDLDVFVSNADGQPSRFFVNDGAGFFAEETDTRWGRLVSVPADQQLTGTNSGPWLGWSCDCAFGDLDDDGDLDLFQSSYGPSFDGTGESRVFLNDGHGVFDELWPWKNASSQPRLRGLDVELADLDGDLDFEIVVASREAQSRIYTNNLYGPVSGSSRFTDTTGPSLLASGTVQSHNATERDLSLADLDDDGDLDLWLTSYVNQHDRLFYNLGGNADGVAHFDVTGLPIKSKPGGLVAVDLADIDGDGDVDAITANSALAYVHIGGNSQGGSVAGEFHRSGISSGVSLYPFFELPASGNSGWTRDIAAADVDGDGDVDLLTARELGFANRLWSNIEGVPDTHAPAFRLVDDGVVEGANVVVHAQVSDNASLALIRLYDVTLTSSVAGAPPITAAMFSQGGGQFRGVIVGAAGAGCVEYTIEAIDLAGNTAIASRTIGACSVFTDLGDALTGIAGDPQLAGTGTLTPGSPNSLDLTDAAPNALAILFAGLADNAVPFKGGTLHPVPVLAAVNLTTSPSGTVSLPFTWPPGVPPGFGFVTQFAIQDGAATKNVALSNALLGTAH